MTESLRLRLFANRRALLEGGVALELPARDASLTIEHALAPIGLADWQGVALFQVACLNADSSMLAKDYAWGRDIATVLGKIIAIRSGGDVAHRAV
jgi:hypothetical protein